MGKWVHAPGTFPVLPVSESQRSGAKIMQAFIVKNTFYLLLIVWEGFLISSLY